VAKAPLDPPANGDHQGLRARLAHPVPPDQRVRRVTPAMHRQFASSLERIAFAAETTKSSLALFVRAARPTERSARRLARQQPLYVYAGDLGHQVATHHPRPALCATWRTATDAWAEPLSVMSQFSTMVRGSLSPPIFDAEPIASWRVVTGGVQRQT
jgi:hypothetical protein